MRVEEETVKRLEDMATVELWALLADVDARIRDAEPTGVWVQVLRQYRAAVDDELAWRGAR
jgi:hypothetical protein